MKRHRIVRWASALSVAIIIALAIGNSMRPQITEAALAASVGPDEQSCSAASLQGAYVVSINGFKSAQAPPQFSISTYSPVMVIGKFTFDGQGGVSRSLTVNFAGKSFPVGDSGSYQINPDCNGSASFSTNSETFSFNSVKVQSIAIVTTTPGEVGAGTLVKQEIQDCGLEAFKGSYVFNGNGLGTFQNPPQPVDAFFPVSVVGSWTFDAKGAVSRSLSLSFAGLAGPYNDSGTYQVSSDCTASAYFPSDAETFELILIDSRRTVFGVVAVGRLGAGSLLKQTE